MVEDKNPSKGRPQISKARPYEVFLLKIESLGSVSKDVAEDGDIAFFDGFIKEYDALNPKVMSLGFSLDTVIRDFDTRWILAGTLVDKMRSSVIAARERARREEEERSRRAKAQEYELCLLSIESGSLEGVVSKFNSLDRATARIDFSLSDYIENFADRWTAAKREVKAETARRKRSRDEAAALAEQTAERERERLEKLRHRKEQRARTAWLRRALLLLGIGASVSVLLALLSVFNEGARAWFIGASLGFFFCFLLGVAFHSVFRCAAPVWICVTLRGLLFAAGVILLFTKSYEIAGCIFLGTALSVALEVITVTVHGNMLGREYRGYCDEDYAPSAGVGAVALVMTPIAFGIALDGLASLLLLTVGVSVTYLVCALVINFSFCYMDYELGDGSLIAIGFLDFAIAITAGIFCLVGNPALFFAGIIMAAAVLIRSIVSLVTESDEEVVYVATFLPIGVAGLVLLIGLPTFFLSGYHIALFNPEALII